MTGGDREAYIREFAERRAALLRIRQAKDAEREREAMARARAVADLLKGRYGARAVLLYGSLAWGGFHEASDIDLMVEGFQGGFWPMYLEAERLASPFELNLSWPRKPATRWPRRWRKEVFPYDA